MTATRGAQTLRLRLALALGASAAEPPPESVVQSLCRYHLLQGLPLSYLLPDPALLPDESIRFFFIDPQWMQALVTGVLSVSAAGTNGQAFVARHLDAAIAAVRQRLRASAEPITGFLLRSGLVSAYPHLDVRAFGTDATGKPPAPGADPDDPTTAALQLPTLRLETIAPDLLLALFAGVPAAIWIEEPHHGLRLGLLTDDQRPQPYVTTPAGAQVPAPFRGTALTPVYAQGDPGSGIGGYDLLSAADRGFAFDYDGSGKLDHLVFYRPGHGAAYILKNDGGTFTPVFSQGEGGHGIGGYDLASPDDRGLAFDYDGSGKLDHLVFYRPGHGAAYILKNDGGTFTPVFSQGEGGHGIGGYDLASPDDRGFAFDYDGSGKLDHLVFYRPGHGAAYILKNDGGTFAPVFSQGEGGHGIGGYDLLSAADQGFAFDYDGSGKLDHLVFYRPGHGAAYILKNDGGTFAPVFSQGEGGHGIGGYDLLSAADQGFAFDYDGSGKLDHLVFYRPGRGGVFVLRNEPLPRVLDIAALARACGTTAPVSSATLAWILLRPPVRQVLTSGGTS